MRISIRTKLVSSIYLTMIAVFIIFGKWMLTNEKKQWEDFQVEQALSFTASTAPDIVRYFGSFMQEKRTEGVFTKSVREHVRYNRDLIRYIILNVKGREIYESEFFDKDIEAKSAEEFQRIKTNFNLEDLKTQKQIYKVVELSNGKKIIDILTPVTHVTGQHFLSVRYFVSFNSVEKKIANIQHDLSLIILLTLSISLLVLVIILSKMTKPIFELISNVKKMRSGNYNARVEKPTKDELGDLSIAFNEMVGAIKHDREDIERKNKELQATNTELKELQEQLIMSERLAAIGQLAAGISHEIDNPIGIILGYAEYIKSELDDDSPIHDELENIVNESKRCRRILGGLLNFARSSPSFQEELNLNDMAKETVAAVSLQSLFKYIKVIEKYDHNIPMIMLDRDKVKQVLINLLINAAQAINKEGKVMVTTKLETEDDKQQIVLCVADNGAGIPPESIKKIFHPFFTTKISTKQKGTGLGLSICQKLIEEQKGTINAKSKVGEGTTFSISFPVKDNTST